MGKKKKNKKKQSPKAAKKATEKSIIAPVENADLPAEEEPSVEDNPPSNDAPEDIISAEPEVEQSPTKVEKSVDTEPALSSVEEKLNLHINAKSRLRRMLPDIIRVSLAFSVIAIGAAIWWKPPLMKASFPVTTYKYKDNTVREATLYRPLAMQERYYVRLPEKLEDRYEWFSIDRRREVVALCDEPEHRFLGSAAIKRGDPLGLDLEFRTIDGHEWLIYFYQDAIVFSNNLLTVRLDAKQEEK